MRFCGKVSIYAAVFLVAAVFNAAEGAGTPEILRVLHAAAVLGLVASLSLVTLRLMQANPHRSGIIAASCAALGGLVATLVSALLLP